MKLESLKSSKFEAFKENELSNIFAIVGGLCKNTNNGSDHISNATETGIQFTDGTKWDLYRNGPCSLTTITEPDTAHPLDYFTIAEGPDAGEVLSAWISYEGNDIHE